MTEPEPSPSVLGPEPLTVDETARLLGVKRSAIRKAIARGTLAATLRPAKYAGERGAYFIEAAEVDRYRAEHRREQP